MDRREDVTPVAHSGSISSTHQRETEEEELTVFHPFVSLYVLKVFMSPCTLPVFAKKKKKNTKHV